MDEKEEVEKAVKRGRIASCEQSKADSAPTKSAKRKLRTPRPYDFADLAAIGGECYC